MTVRDDWFAEGLRRCPPPAFLPPRRLVPDDIPRGRPHSLVRGGDDPRSRPAVSSAAAGRAPAPRRGLVRDDSPNGRQRVWPAESSSRGDTRYPSPPTASSPSGAATRATASSAWPCLRRRRPPRPSRGLSPAAGGAPRPLPLAASSVTTSPTAVRADSSAEATIVAVLPWPRPAAAGRPSSPTPRRGLGRDGIPMAVRAALPAEAATPAAVQWPRPRRAPRASPSKLVPQRRPLPWGR